jgi:hypothetical protein
MKISDVKSLIRSSALFKDFRTSPRQQFSSRQGGAGPKPRILTERLEMIHANGPNNHMYFRHS